MQNFKNSLAHAVKSARLEQKLTQAELAEQLNIDTRTIINIENKRGNPKFDLLCPLITKLRIPANKIFYPETVTFKEYKEQLLYIFQGCDDEIEAIIPMIEHLIMFYRNTQNKISKD